MEEVARRSHASGKSSRIVFSPTSVSIQRTVHRLSQLPTHARLLSLGVRVWQSDADVANCVCVEVGSTHVSGGNQERVLNSKHLFLTRNTEWDSQSFQRRCCREDWFDSFMAHLRTHQTRTVTRSFGATLVGIDPFEANWFASCSRPCFPLQWSTRRPTNTLFAFSRAFLTSCGSNGPPLTSSSASHSS